MVGGADDLREHVAAELTELLAYDGPLSPSGTRSTVMAPQNFRHGAVTPTRRELWQELRGRYLARQPNVVRDGRAALLTAGVPGANWPARWISTPATRAGAEAGPSPRGIP